MAKIKSRDKRLWSQKRTVIKKKESHSFLITFCHYHKIFEYTKMETSSRGNTKFFKWYYTYIFLSCQCYKKKWKTTNKSSTFHHILPCETNRSILEKNKDMPISDSILTTVKPVLTTTFLKRPPVLNDHVVVLP